MRKESIFLLILIISIMFSLNFVVATEENDTSELISSDLEIMDSDSSINFSNDCSKLNHQNSYGETLELFSEEKSKTIYVGHNNITNGGNGSKDNPFTTFKAACDDVNGEDNVTIYVFGGEYKLGEGMSGKVSGTPAYPLMFNASNLNIVGINGSVIIKNYNTVKKNGYPEAFSLTSTSGNFTFSNLIFDYSDVVSIFLDEDNPYEYRTTYFFPFFGQANLGIYNNCSFLGKTEIARNLMYNSKFNDCYFECTLNWLFTKISANTTHSFKNCILNINNVILSQYYYLPCNILIEDVWFGDNKLPSYLSPTRSHIINESGMGEEGYVIPVTRYAIFNVTQNYLGNDEYEIIGKLTWNGTNDQDGMENFQPMTVTLLSENGGEIASSVPLVNGTFKTIYKNSASTHDITATLHNCDIPLKFTTVNITADESSIKYGDDQNITVNLSQAIDNNVTITVSNATYNKSYIVKVNGTDSFNYTIPDRLKEGTYDINITLNENNYFGLNTTTLRVSKVSDYKFEVALSSDVKVGDNATITVTLPDDVNGTVTVKFGNEEQNLSAETLMTFNFTNLKAITYPINVTYSGNDKYTSKNFTDSVTVDKADSVLEIEDEEFIYGDEINVPFNMTNANGVKVSVLNSDEDEVATASSDSGIISLDTLPAGEYTLEVTTVVDEDNYEWVSKSPKLIIHKANSTLIISDKEFAYAAEAVIHAVTENSTDDVIAVLTDENDIEIPVTVSGDDITLPVLDVGKYTLTVTTNVDDNHNNVTESIIITVVKADPIVDVALNPESDITVEDEITVTVSLPVDATGLVLISIDDVKLYDELTEGIVEFTLPALSADTYTISVRYMGDKNYNEAKNDTVTFTVGKLDTAMTVESNADCEGNAGIYVYFEDYVTGTVTFFNGDDELCTVGVDDEDYANYYLYELEKGNYIITAVFTSDLYNNLTVSTSFSIDFGYMYVDHDYSVKAGKNLTVYVELPEDAKGTVNVTVGNYSEEFNTTNETLTVYVPDLKEGDYTLTVLYSGDEKYQNRTYTGEVEVYQPTMELDYNRTISADDSAVITLTFLDKGTVGNLTSAIGNMSYSVPVVDGVATLTLNNLEIGENEIELIFVEEYDETYLYAYIDVEKANITSEIASTENKTSIALPEESTGNVTFYINGKEYTVNITGGVASVDLPELSAGNHTIVAVYPGDDRHNPITVIDSIEVTKKPSSINADSGVIEEGETATITVNVTEGATGVVLIDVDGAKFYGEIKDNAATVDVTGLAAGNYTAIVYYGGDDKFEGSSGSVAIEVKSKPVAPEPEEANITVAAPEVKAGESGSVDVNIPNATGNVSVIVDGKETTVPLVNGSASVDLDNLTGGNHSVVVIYPGDETHKSAYSTTSFHVEEEPVVPEPSKEDSNVTISIPAEINPGESNNVTVSIPGATGNVSVFIDGIENTMLLINGSAVIPMENLSGGNHSVVVVYPGDETHSPVYDSTQFYLKTFESEFANITINDGKLNAILVDNSGKAIVNATIKYSVGNVNGTIVTDENGLFTIAGKKGEVVTIEYDGTDVILPTSISITLKDITPAKVVTMFNVTDGTSIPTYAVDFGAGERGKTVAFKLTDANGNPIANATVNFAYKTTYFNRTTDENGIVSIGISTQIAGEYLCALSYLGDETHNATFVPFSFNIQKKTITISASAKTFKSTAKTKKYTVTLKTKAFNSKDGKVYLKAGKKVTLKINGKTYTAKTNAKGKATFSLKITKKGKYTAKISFAGDVTYKAASKSVKITIK